MIRACQKSLAVRARRLRQLPLLRRFLRHQEGATAIEFGLVAAPFLALTFAIMETAFMFFAGQTLETAATSSSRLIMTGQAQMQGYNQNQFKQAVCDRIYGLINCAAGLQIDVRTYTNFSSVSTSNPIRPDGTLQTGFVYQPGGPSEIVVVRLMYEWPVYVPMLGNNLGNMAGNKRLLMSTVAFRNEPFQ